VASHHGIHTHNALKAIHLDDHMGSGASPQGCCPNVDIEVIPSKYGAVEKWDCKVRCAHHTSTPASVILATETIPPPFPPPPPRPHTAAAATRAPPPPPRSASWASPSPRRPWTAAWSSPTSTASASSP
jgi:hypothetical protein